MSAIGRHGALHASVIKLRTQLGNSGRSFATAASRPSDLLAHRPGAELAESVSERLALDLDVAPLVRDRVEALARLEHDPESFLPPSVTSTCVGPTTLLM
jgi:hypothetical protein